MNKWLFTYLGSLSSGFARFLVWGSLFLPLEVGADSSGACHSYLRVYFLLLHLEHVIIVWEYLRVEAARACVLLAELQLRSLWEEA